MNDVEELSRAGDITYMVHANIDSNDGDNKPNDIATTCDKDNKKAYVACAKDFAVAHTLTATSNHDSRYSIEFLWCDNSYGMLSRQ